MMRFGEIAFKKIGVGNLGIRETSHSGFIVFGEMSGNLLSHRLVYLDLSNVVFYTKVVRSG